MRDEKKQQKEALKEEMLRLGNLQRECKEEKIPVYITFDGYDGAGKGVQIGRLMQALDPTFTPEIRIPRRKRSARSSGGLRSMPRRMGGSRSMTQAGTGGFRRTGSRES